MLLDKVFRFSRFLSTSQTLCFCLSDSVYLFYFYSFCVFISLFLFSWYRSSHQKCSIKKGVLRNFTEFTGNHLCQSLFFKKVAGLRPATLLKNKPWHKRFLVNFAKFLRTPFLEHLWTTASCGSTHWFCLYSSNLKGTKYICGKKDCGIKVCKSDLKTRKNCSVKDCEWIDFYWKYQTE